MGTIELKSNIHQIVEGIESEQVLQTIYDFLKLKDQAKAGYLWNQLSDEEKDEVLLSYEESEDDGNLVDARQVFKNLS